MQVQHNYRKQDQLFHMVMHLPVALAAISEAVQSILAQEFGRTSTIIPNSVDCDRFRPGPLSCHPYTAVLTAPANEVTFQTVHVLYRFCTLESFASLCSYDSCHAMQSCCACLSSCLCI